MISGRVTGVPLTVVLFPGPVIPGCVLIDELCGKPPVRVADDVFVPVLGSIGIKDNVVLWFFFAMFLTFIEEEDISKLTRKSFHKVGESYEKVIKSY